MSGSRIARARRQRSFAPRRGAPAWAVALALLGFALRSLIPMGFEPADGSLSLVLCHEGFPAQFFSSGHGPGSHGQAAGGARRDAHCVFCNGTSPAPALSFAGIVRVAPVAIGFVSLPEFSSQSVRLAHIPQARAPPTLA